MSLPKLWEEPHPCSSSADLGSLWSFGKIPKCQTKEQTHHTCMFLASPSCLISLLLPLNQDCMTSQTESVRWSRKFYRKKIGETSDLMVIEISPYVRMILKPKEPEHLATWRQTDRYCGSFSLHRLLVRCCWSMTEIHEQGWQIHPTGTTICSGYFSAVIGHNYSATG